jgi:hypothetical protein
MRWHTKEYLADQALEETARLLGRVARVEGF